MRDEDASDRGVEHRAGAPLDLGQGILGRARGPIRTLGDHRVVGVADADDAGRERRVLACTWWLNEQGERPTQVALAAHAGTDIKMTSQVVRSLERKRLLKREVDAADTRARRLRVTKRGAELAVGAISVVEEVDSAFFADIPERQTLSFLRRLGPGSRKGRST